MSERSDSKAKLANPDCKQCRGTGYYMYDYNHGTVCNLCCLHDEGYWLLEEHYGEDNGKLCCLAGCGMKLDEIKAQEFQRQLNDVLTETECDTLKEVTYD